MMATDRLEATWRQEPESWTDVSACPATCRHSSAQAARGHLPIGLPADVGSVIDLWLGSRLVECEFFGCAAAE